MLSGYRVRRRETFFAGHGNGRSKNGTGTDTIQTEHTSNKRAGMFQM
jgi:hypothetical protein